VRAAKQRLLEVAELCNQFESEVLSPALVGSLANKGVASVMHLAHRDIRSSGLQSHLSKRAGRNVHLVDNVEAKVGRAWRCLCSAWGAGSKPALGRSDHLPTPPARAVCRCRRS
jgi:hypothetical protein